MRNQYSNACRRKPVNFITVILTNIDNVEKYVYFSILIHIFRQYMCVEILRYSSSIDIKNTQNDDFTHATLCAHVRDTCAAGYNIKRIWLFVALRSLLPLVP